MCLSGRAFRTVAGVSVPGSRGMLARLAGNACTACEKCLCGSREMLARLGQPSAPLRKNSMKRAFFADFSSVFSLCLRLFPICLSDCFGTNCNVFVTNCNARSAPSLYLCGIFETYKMRNGIETYFSVCLFYRPSVGSYICSLSVLPQEKMPDRRAEDVLVYSRRFNEMDEALGHKLFLEHLSCGSLEQYIKQCGKPDREGAEPACD